MIGKIEIRHGDLVDLLLEADDREFDKVYLEEIIKHSERDDLAYYKELIEDRETKLAEREEQLKMTETKLAEREEQLKMTDADRIEDEETMSSNVVYKGTYRGFKYWIKKINTGSLANLFPGRCSLATEWFCGYVALPKGHPMHGQDYDNLSVDCHGGLTYSNLEGNDWVIGFDCNHTYDNEKVFTEGWLRGECESIIDQVDGGK